ncbi:MAG: hypothetical protein ACKV2O_22360 [Acidimicrobiales bacterium]
MDPASREPAPVHAGIAVGKLWIDGKLVPGGDGLTLQISPSGWQLSGMLAAQDPFARVYGLSLQLTDGRALHGPARLRSAQGGLVVFEGVEARLGPEGS